MIIDLDADPYRWMVFAIVAALAVVLVFRIRLYPASWAVSGRPMDRAAEPGYATGVYSAAAR